MTRSAALPRRLRTDEERQREHIDEEEKRGRCAAGLSRWRPGARGSPERRLARPANASQRGTDSTRRPDMQPVRAMFSAAVVRTVQSIRLAPAGTAARRPSIVFATAAEQPMPASRARKGGVSTVDRSRGSRWTGRQDRNRSEGPDRHDRPHARCRRPRRQDGDRPERRRQHVDRSRGSDGLVDKTATARTARPSRPIARAERRAGRQDSDRAERADAPRRSQPRQPTASIDTAVTGSRRARRRSTAARGADGAIDTVRTGPQGGVSTVDRARGCDGLIDKTVTGPQGGVTTVDRTRGADGAIDSMTIGPKGGTTVVDRSRNADGTINRTVTTTPATK